MSQAEPLMTANHGHVISEIPEDVKTLQLDVLKHIYTSLQPGYIRLVTLHPGSLEAKISCSLNDVALNSRPSYEALSYVWGDSKDSKVIWLNKWPFSARDNLESALRHLRLLSCDRILWIDALCINQLDIPERNIQVQGMRKIYREATKVILWIGLADESTTSLLDSIIEGEKDNFSAIWKTKVVANRDLAQSAVTAMDFYTRDYWDRVWVIQEIAFAKEITIVCGSRTLAYKGLIRAIEVLEEDMLSAIRAELSVNGEESCAMVIVTLSSRGPRGLPEPGTVMEHLFEERLFFEYLDKRCTDPRDKVYGLLGLASGKIQEQLTIDYSIEVSEVFTRATKAIIQASGSITVICCPKPRNDRVSQLHTRPNLPSWVVDFGTHDRFPNYSLALIGGRSQFQVDSSIGCTFHFTSDGSILRVKGLFIGTICRIQDETISAYIAEQNSLDLESTNAFLQYFLLCQRKFEADLGTEFIETITCRFGDSSEQDTESFTILCDALTTVSSQTKSKILDGLKYPTFSPAELRMIHLLHAIVQGRYFFSYTPRQLKLDNSFTIGMCPVNAELGDEIYILAGCKVPVILRPNGDYHLVVGEAYVNGCMQGEAMYGVLNGTETLVDIHLC